jgi:hypothetical protein
MFANAFTLKGVPNALSLFGVIDTKKHYITKSTRNTAINAQWSQTATLCIKSDFGGTQWIDNSLQYRR